MGKYSLGFSVIIVLDHLLNVLLLGRIGTCLSTRAYIQSVSGDKQERWLKIRKFIDKLMREEHHCLKSFAWEINRKKDWINYHLHLLN